jgi:RND family efflux transporter MFP subunit
LALLGCQKASGPAAQAPDASSEAPASKSKVVSAALSKWPRTVHVQGSLLADECAVIGAKVAGRVKQVNVDVGSTVRRGDTLATLDTEDLELKVKQAEAQLEQACAKLGMKPSDSEKTLDRLKVPTVVQADALRKEAMSNLERAKALVDQKAIVVEELQQKAAIWEVAESKYVSALRDVDEMVAVVGMRRAELALARQVLVDANVPAPFDGAVQQRYVAPGAYLQVGQPVVSLVRTDPLRFHAAIPERESTQVRPKQKVRIRVEGEAQPLQGEVSRVSPSLDLSNRSLIAEVDLANPDSRLRAGLFAEAEIVVDPAALVLTVPSGAVSEFAGVEKVHLLRDREMIYQPIQTGRREGDLVEVLRGLSPGDVIAADFRTQDLQRAGAERPEAPIAERAK